VSTSGSYLSTNDSRVIAGLGNATAIKTVQVDWPSGQKQTLSNLGLDRYVTINEGDAKQ